MEEKKKRVRPTIAQMEQLEDTVHIQCIELRAWREKYNKLFKEHRELKNRGFWARVFNK